MQAQVPQSFAPEGDPDFLDTDAMNVELAWIDHIRVVYERAQHNWSAYAPDLHHGGVISTGATREQVERNMREAITIYKEELARDRAERPSIYAREE